MFDIVLAGGTIVDGTRKKPYVGDVCIKDGKIAEILEHYDGECGERVDITGKTVTPGFIDIHSHSDACPLVWFEPESKLHQGITTEIVGNCGMSILPSGPETWKGVQQYFGSQLDLPLGDLSIEGMWGVEEYAQRVAEHGCSTNYGMLVGHGCLRGGVVGFEDRDPNPEEMQALKDVLERDLKAGAFGMSLGLIYPPSAFCQTEELVELAKVLKKYDAILAVHMRNEGPRIFQAVDEMIDITRRSGVHLEISHLKLMGKPQWGRAQELLDKIAAARAEGLNVNCDQYPYTATSTSMTALLPHWAHDGGHDALVERVQKPTEQLKLDANQELENRGGPDRVMVADTHGQCPECEGKTIKELADAAGVEPIEMVMEMLRRCNGSVSCIYFTIDENDMLLILKQMHISIGSDGYGFSYDKNITRGTPHPRSFGTFPCFLRLVREHKLMPLEDAVYKITGLPAQILGMKDRGILKPGMVADLTVFDAEHVRDTSEFTDSIRKPEGIEHVLVKGVFALRDGKATLSRTGGVLRKG